MKRSRNTQTGIYRNVWIITLVLLVCSMVMCLVLKECVPAAEEAGTVIASSEEGEVEKTEKQDHFWESEDNKEPVADKVIEAPWIDEAEIKETDSSPESEEMMPESTSGSVENKGPDVPVTPKDEVIEETKEPIIPSESPTPEQTPNEEPIPVPEEQETQKPSDTPVLHEHSWMMESWYQEPTCSNGGLVMEICVHCGETQITGGTPTGEHSYQIETPGDCCSEEVVVCGECNFREVRAKDIGNHIDVEEGFCYGCGNNTE